MVHVRILDNSPYQASNNAELNTDEQCYLVIYTRIQACK